jgi:hypothetical protein
MAIADKSGFARKNTVHEAVLLLLGGVRPFGTARSWSHELAADSAEAMETARGMRIVSNRPHIPRRRPNLTTAGWFSVGRSVTKTAVSA